MEQIQEIVGILGDTLNKAHLFDSYIKKEVQMSLPKVIAILVNFQHKMEAILGAIWKLVPGSPTESSRPPFPPPKETPQKEKPLEGVKTLLPQQLGKELIAKSAKIEVPTVVTKTKIGKDLETPKISSKSFP